MTSESDGMQDRADSIRSGENALARRIFHDIRDASQDMHFTPTTEATASSPLLAAFHDCFEAVAFTSLAIDGALNPLASTLRRARNGRGMADGYLTRVLASSALRDQHPSLAVPVETQLPKYGFTIIDSLAFEGSLAIALRAGGPYRSTPAPIAHTLARRFRQSLFGDRFEDIHVASTNGWSDWFFNYGWDHGWIVTDFAHARVHVLCASGND